VAAGEAALLGEVKEGEVGVTDEDRVIFWSVVVAYAFCLAAFVGVCATLILPLFSRCGTLT
jgi:hypothetical protein